MRNSRRALRACARAGPVFIVASAYLWTGDVAVDPAVPPAVAQGGLSASSFQLMWSTGALSDKGHPIAESSPMEADLDASGPSVVVGDRSGYLYAYHLSGGTPAPGWPANLGVPIDSTPSVATLPGSSYDTVFVGAGDAADSNSGGYYAFEPGGEQLWHSTIEALTYDAHPATGVQASLTQLDSPSGSTVFAGSLDQMAYDLNVSNGQMAAGGVWPYFSADSVFSTAAAADLYGTGQDELVVGGASTAGIALGVDYPQGGHVRVLNAEGYRLYDYDTNQEVDSSPAIGDFLSGDQPGIVIGTGDEFPGASDTDTLLAFNNRLGLAWSDTLDGVTSSSPALADVQGNSQLDVVEGTDTGTGGSVWVLNGSSGATIWHESVVGRVIGSVVAADLTGQGYQDLLVPTTHGVEVLDGESGAEVTVLGATFGFQNSPLVTDDPNGTAGITIAGYNGNNQGVIEHFEVRGSNGALAVGSGSWPMFHHDPGLSGVNAALPDLGRVTPPPPTVTAGNGQVTVSWAPASGSSSPVTGYNVYVATGDGRVSAVPANGATPVSGDSYTVTGLSNGSMYWFEVTAVNAAGEGAPSGQVGPVVPYGPPGSPQGLAATAGVGQVALSWAAPASNGGSVITGYDVYESNRQGSQGTKVASTPTKSYTVSGLTNGTTYYFEVTAVNAAGEGPASAQVTAVPVTSVTTTTTTTTTVPPVTTTTVPAPPPVPVGYRLATAGGQVSAFGKVSAFRPVSSPSTARPVSHVAAIVSTPDGRGYWLAEANGVVLAAGDAHLYGSLAHQLLNKPIVGMAATPDGNGYWLVSSDGGIFAFGDARYFGSTGNIRLNKPIVGMAATPDGKGYWLVASDGGIFSFGDAGYFGSTGHVRLHKPIVGMAATPSGKGYWLVASDGGIFAYGDAGYFGSLVGKHLAEPVVGISL